MKKNFIQDVIPPRKTIQNIELSSRLRKIKENDVQEKLPRNRIVESVEKETVVSYEYRDDSPKKSFRKMWYVAIGILMLVVVISIWSLFKSATVTITPRQESKSLNEIFTAKKDATVGLSYQIVTISKDIEKTVEATGEQKVEKKSTGKIIIYNNSTQQQKLIATTRFETDGSLVFRLLGNATIPARTIKDGKIVAGSIEVSVEADTSGSQYNIGLKDFTIPGFKGDPKFGQFYARSKTPMTGGFSGIQKVVSKDIMNSAEKEMETDLQASLIKDISSQIPENFVLYEKGIIYKFEALEQLSDTGELAVIKKRGVASAVIVDRASLTKAISLKLLPQAKDDLVKIGNLDNLEFGYSNSAPFDPNTSLTTTFSIKGDVDFVWVIDENKLKLDILGLKKDNVKSVIKTYINIANASVKISPFWSSSIPKNSEKVEIISTLVK